MIQLALFPIQRALILSVFVIGTCGMTGSADAQTPSGATLYQAKCGGCHSLDSNRIGPAHRGVVGRKPASVSGYAYSGAIRKLTGVWTPARLDAWLQGPQKVAPGSKMFLTIADPATRASIIAYLQSVSPQAPATRN